MTTPLASSLAELTPGGEPQQSSAFKPLTIWKPSQFLKWVEPVGNQLLLPAYLTRGNLTTLIGQGGLGKTRLALWLAICQILGKLWCGLETAAEPVKWLFLGDENSIARWKEDLQRMFSTLTAYEISRVEEFLRLPALVEMEDCDIWLGDVATQIRIKATIESERPGTIVADPLGNFAPGDIAKPGEMKEAIRILRNIIRPAAPQAATMLVHHSRTGRQNIMQGIGWDAANFGLGGKALFSAARCQMNLMPGSANDDTRLVLHCAKANNCVRFETRGLIFDTETFTYKVDPDFDVEVWLADVEGRAQSGHCLCNVKDIVCAVRDGYVTTQALIKLLQDAYSASKRTAERLISRAVKSQGITQLTRGRFALGRKSEKFLQSME